MSTPYRTVWLFLFASTMGCPAAEVEVVEPAPVEEPEPEAQMRVFFSSPEDGATVTSPVKIVMGVDGMEVREAGSMDENTGHHHIIIGPAGIDEGQMVPKDETHIHFGGGQTEAEVELEPGDHKLTMQFADGNHMSFGDKLATTITITVEAGGAEGAAAGKPDAGQPAPRQMKAKRKAR